MKNLISLIVLETFLITLKLEAKRDSTLAIISEVSCSYHPVSILYSTPFPGIGFRLAHKIGNNPKKDRLLCIEYNTLYGYYSNVSHFYYEHANVTLFNAGMSFIIRRNLGNKNRGFFEWGGFFDVTARNFQEGEANYYIPYAPQSHVELHGHISNINTFYPGFSFGGGYKIPVKKTMIILSTDLRIPFSKIKSADWSYRPATLRFQLSFRIPRRNK